MKLIRKIILSLLIIIVLSGAGIYIYLLTLKPQYSGELTLKGLKQEVEVLFDDYGIPHIYAQNQEDAYFAFGYVHAQERLFQMEILRRVSAGRLAEILGEELVETDRFFRTLGIKEIAGISAAKYLSDTTEPYQKCSFAYLAGLNQFIEKGKTPIEFHLIGIPKEKFVPEDLYLITGFMSFTFAHGLRTDPIVSRVMEKYGPEYLKDWAVNYVEETEKIPVYPISKIQDPTLPPNPLKGEVPPPTSSSQTSNIQHPTSNIKHPRSNIQYPTSNIQHQLTFAINKILNNLPVPLFLGSNGWVVSGQKTKSGKVIFAFDAHITYSQPSVWYEAHLEYPGFSIYGNHLAGIPLAIIGHNRFAAWGFPMFENDDMDFYREKSNPENADQVWANGHWEDLQIREEVIKVKNGEDVIFKVRTSRHGPIMSDVIKDLNSRLSQKGNKGNKEEGVGKRDGKVPPIGGDLGGAPVSLWWTFLKFPNQFLQAAWLFSHAVHIDDVRNAASIIHAPGLSVLYGDKEGNIAWWAAGKLIKRPPHVNSKLILDGASGKDEPLGYYNFEQNPQSENPPSGFVYAANNQPDTIAGILYPGYYVPEDRAKRITGYLKSDKKWTVEEMKKMNTDVISDAYPLLAREIIDEISPPLTPSPPLIPPKGGEKKGGRTGQHSTLPQGQSNGKVSPFGGDLEGAWGLGEASSIILREWNGGHQLNDIAPVIYYKLIYHILQKTVADELGDEDFQTFLTTHLMKRTIPVLLRNDSSVWWDNVNTPDIRETRKMVFSEAFEQTIRELEDQLGSNILEWTWDKVHTLEHVHLVGRKKFFDKIFNAGPFPVPGGNEVINNYGFTMNGEGHYKVKFGPSMRILIDFADIENSLSINPTGQSGYFMSEHYDDQAEMYNKGIFRKQMMNREEIESTQTGRLVLKPE